MLGYIEQSLPYHDNFVYITEVFAKCVGIREAIMIYNYGYTVMTLQGKELLHKRGLLFINLVF